MSTRQIHVFISHSWAYSNHYDTLSKWIFNKRWSVGQASNPWAQEKKPSIVQQNAEKLVGWNEKSVINEIWSLYNK